MPSKIVDLIRPTPGPAARDLEEEIVRLRATVDSLTAKLEVERHSPSPQPSEPVDIYVFDDEDSLGDAFDDFMNHPDPHLDKIRSFLLG